MRPPVEDGSWSGLRIWVAKAPVDEVLHGSKLPELLDKVTSRNVSAGKDSSVVSAGNHTPTTEELDFLAATFKRLFKLLQTDKDEVVSFLGVIFPPTSSRLEARPTAHDEQDDLRASALCSILFTALRSPFKPITLKGSDLLIALAQLLNGLRTTFQNHQALDTILEPILRTACAPLSNVSHTNAHGQPLSKIELSVLSKLLKPCPPIFLTSRSSAYLPPTLLDNLFISLSTPKERDLAGQRGKVLLELFAVEGYLERDAQKGMAKANMDDEGVTHRMGSMRVDKEDVDGVMSEEEEGPEAERGVAERRDLLVSKLLEWVDPIAFLTSTQIKTDSMINPTSERTKEGKGTDSATRKYDLETLLDGLGKYVFPTLFQQDSLIGSMLLDRLSAPSYTPSYEAHVSTTSTSSDSSAFASIPSWIQILSIYLLNTPSSTTQVAVPKDTFLLACHHRSHAVRLAAWRCLVESREEKRKIGEGLVFVGGGNEDVRGEDAEVGSLIGGKSSPSAYWEILESWVSGNMNIWSSDFRSAYLSSFNTFVKRLQSTIALSTRQSQRISPEDPLTAVQAEHQAYLAVTSDFTIHLVNETILPIVKWPLKSNYAKMTTAIDMLRSLMEAELLIPLDVLGSGYAIRMMLKKRDVKGGDRAFVHESISSPEVIDALLACLASNYKDIRDRASKLIDKCSILFSKVAESDNLINEALARLDGARNTHAETGGLLLSAIYKKAPKRVQVPTKSVFSIDGASSDGPSSVAVPARPGPSKKDLEPRQARDLELLLRLIDRLELHLMGCEADLAIGMRDTPLHGVLFALATIVDCLDQRGPISRAVVKQLFDRLIDMIRRTWHVARQVLVSTAESGSPDHESVRVNAFLDADDDQQEVSAGEVSEELLVVLSNSWRSMKEASNLLAAIHRNGHFLWVITSEENTSSGKLFLSWLSEIRHRGTFSSVAMSFESFLDVVRRLPAGQAMQREWLEHIIADIDRQHRSTTRRSAALPYCVLALVQGDESYFNIASRELLANINNAFTTSEAKVHSINVLRVLLNDARQTSYLSACFEDCMQTSLTAYGSQDWSVRNAALHFFSTLIVRVFGRDINKATSDLQQAMSLEATLLKYPRLIPMWQEVLSSPGSSDSASFLVILALRVLRVSSDLSEAKALRDKLDSYLRSPEVKLRMAASEAFAALTAPAMALDLMLKLTSAAVDAGDENRAHGLLLAAKALIAIHGLASITSAENDVNAAISSLLSNSLQRSSEYRAVAQALGDHFGCGNSSSTSSGPSGPSDWWQIALSDASEVNDRIAALRAIAAGTAEGDEESLNRWETLHQAFVRSSIVPLREAILPVLGMLSHHEADERTVQALELARSAAEVDRSAECRLAAAMCVKYIASVCLGQEHEADIPVRLACFDLVWTLLQDDDEDIRFIATEVVAHGYANSAPLSQARAVEIWIDIAQEMSDDEAGEWERLVWKRLDFRNRLARVVDEQSERSELFASEPANIFVEEQEDVSQLTNVYIRNLAALPQDDRTILFARRRGELLQLIPPHASTEKVSPIDPRRESKMLQDLIVSSIKAIEAAML